MYFFFRLKQHNKDGGAIKVDSDWAAEGTIQQEI